VIPSGRVRSVSCRDVCRSPSGHVVHVALLALVLLSTQVTAQSSPSPAGQSPTAAVLAEYQDIIKQYRSDDTVGALHTLLGHDRNWVMTAVGALARDPGVQLQEVKAAVLVHTETIAGQWVTGEDVQLQLSAARELIDLRVGSSPPLGLLRRGAQAPYRLPDEFRRRWHLVIAWSLQRALQYPMLIAHLDTMIARYRDDPDVLLTQGTFYESLGWMTTSPSDWDVTAPRLLTSATRSRRGQLGEAERALRAALQAAPALDEARLRLGRVLTELGRSDDALAMLAPLEAEADAAVAPTTAGGLSGRRDSSGTLADRLSTRWQYMVKLFIGSAEERRGHFDRSIEAYRAAVDILPQCQTPWVALSAALRASGDPIAAADAVLKIATINRQCQDPWWEYRYGSWAWRTEPLLVAMRAEVR
jgi:tetratricopeptide (TPR) repeat protein